MTVLCTQGHAARDSVLCGPRSPACRRPLPTAPRVMLSPPRGLSVLPGSTYVPRPGASMTGARPRPGHTCSARLVLNTALNSLHSVVHSGGIRVEMTPVQVHKGLGPPACRDPLQAGRRAPPVLRELPRSREDIETQPPHLF